MHGQENVLIYFLIYLAAMVIVVPISKKIGLGAVLGYLLAGLFIGPYVLNLVQTTQTIMSLAELGIVLMLFTIGLELDLNRLWGMRNLVFGFGLMQMVVCGVVFSILSIFFGLSGSVALIIGMTLALSSTAVVVQLMNDRKLMVTQVGKAVFGVLLFQDIAAIPILIAVSILFPSEGSHQFNVLYAIGAVLGLVIVGRYLISYALGWIARNSSRELFVGAALLLVILVMELMTLVGISAGLGAFIAGVLLASSEYRHELEADLDPFKGLFLGLFFITVGANIDLKLLVQAWPTIVGMLIVFVASKIALMYLQATILKMASKERLVFSSILAQGGEFGFVVITLGVAGNMIDKDMSSKLNLVIALSIALSPILMKIHDYYSNCYFDENQKSAENMDKDMDHSQVIIAGFGRFGQIVGRFLLSNGIASTIMDHDSEHIEDMRKFGFKVYYGDATRLDLLEIAGAAKAKILVVAVDDKDTINHIIETAQKHFPHLKIVTRVKDVPHLYEVMKLEVAFAQRELFEASISTGRAALEILGFGRYHAKEMADNFRRTNIEQVIDMAKLRENTDRNDFIKVVRESREELERQLQQEVKTIKRHR